MKLKQALTLILLSLSLTGVAFAEDVADTETPSEEEETVEEVVEEVEEEVEEEVDCYVGFIADQEYSAQLVTTRRKLKMEPGEDTQWKFFVKNTSNIPWFSSDSGCKNFHVDLVSDKSYGRVNEFHTEGAEGWKNNSMITMDQDRVDPGEIASFTATATAGLEDDVSKQYFVPVVQDVAQMTDGALAFVVIVGNPEFSASNVREMLAFSFESGTVTNIDLDAPRVIVIDKTEQREYLLLGDQIIKSYLISTGLPGTETPNGLAKILFKQDVRIGSKYPHYIMPGFMGLGFQSHGYSFVGYGKHGSPVLGSSTLRAKIRALQAQGKSVPVEYYKDDEFRFS